MDSLERILSMADLMEGYSRQQLVTDIIGRFSNDDGIEFFRTRDLAERWKVSKRCVSLWTEQGKLKATKFGVFDRSPLRYAKKDVLAFEELNRNNSLIGKEQSVRT